MHLIWVVNCMAAATKSLWMYFLIIVSNFGQKHLLNTLNVSVNVIVNVNVNVNVMTIPIFSGFQNISEAMGKPNQVTKT